MPETSPAAPRQRGLDTLRGLAALSVMLFHFTTGYPILTGHPFRPSFSVSYGNHGVDLFFIISGFVIFLTLDRTTDWRNFLVSRVARLWPTFVTCLTLTAAVLWLSNLSWRHPVPLTTFAVNVTLMPEVFKCPPVDPSYWSIAYEVTFYTIAGTTYFLGGARRTELLCLSWLAMAVLIRREFNIVPKTIEVLTAYRYAPLFIIGIMLHRIRTRQSGWPAITLLFLAVILAQRTYFVERPLSRVEYKAMVAVFTLAVWFATMERSPLARIWPLVFLGDISYPLYLIHQIIGYVLIERLTDCGLGPTTSVMVASVFAILVAFVIHHVIEEPGQKFLRRVFTFNPPTALEGRPQLTK